MSRLLYTPKERSNIEESLKHNALNICYSLYCTVYETLLFGETPIFSSISRYRNWKENEDTLQTP